MRVALCLSGQTRTFKSCYSSLFEKIIKPFNCDIFVHTWLYTGNYKRKNEDFHYTSVPYNFNRYEQFNTDEYVLEPTLFRLLKPKRCVVEVPQKELFIKHCPPGEEKFFNSLMMHYSISKANDLKCEYERDHRFVYDLVIRCRFDLEIKRFEPENLTDAIVIPRNQLFPSIGDRLQLEIDKMRADELDGYMPNDQFAYGRSDSMNYYSQIFKKFCVDSSIFPIHPEGLLSAWLWASTKYRPFISSKTEVRIVRS